MLSIMEYTTKEHMTQHRLQVIVKLLGRKMPHQAPKLYKVMRYYLAEFSKPLRGPYPNHVDIRMNEAERLGNCVRYVESLGVRGLRKTLWYQYMIPD